MRLLDTDSDTAVLHEFFGDAVPDYAILSHRWGADEVSFQDLEKRKNLPYRAMISRDGVSEEVTIQEVLDRSIEDGLGWQKIKHCCALAARRGYKYVWIDTCCINKESSAELTEAINSMFRWYSQAKVCFAYLSDVTDSAKDPRATDSEFRRSKWFSRGWTLQEMLAPRVLEFYSRDWQPIGTRDTLSEVVAERTGIPHSLQRWQDASVAAKMSWASQRECTRLEDTAYSLLGLFGINMPLLYGEGRRAFYRLQLEILRESADESIFAWTIDTPGTDSDYVGLLADSPKNFAGSGEIKRYDFFPRPHYSMTNKGLGIETRFFELLQQGNIKIIPLNCSLFKEENDYSKRPAPFILIIMVNDAVRNYFFRIRPQKHVITKSKWEDIWSKYKETSGSHLRGVSQWQSIYIMV